MADEKPPFTPPQNISTRPKYETASRQIVGNDTYNIATRGTAASTGNITSGGPFIQPYPSSQTQAKQIIMERKDPSLGASLNSIMMAGASQREAGRDVLMDARLRNLLITIFSQEANGGDPGADSVQSIIDDIEGEAVDASGTDPSYKVNTGSRFNTISPSYVGNASSASLSPTPSPTPQR